MKGKACFPNATIQRVQIGVAYGMFPCMCTHTDECAKSSDPPITIPGRVCVCVCVLPFYPFGDPTLSAIPTPTLSHIWQRCTFACFDTLFRYLHCKRVLFHRSVSCLHRLRGVCVSTHVPCT